MEHATLDRMKARVALAIVAALCACGGSRPAEDASRAALRSPVAAAADPTVHPARLVPVRPGDDDKTFGVEPGGGRRMLVSGVRVIRLAGGGVESAVDPLPSVPSATLEIPERLGGGFLFVLGQMIWRADKWLSPLKPLFNTQLAPTQLFVGLDRAYVRLSNNAYIAFDPRLGTPMDLGPWPGSPDVTRFVAADGWRAVAIADLRGAVATFDAGGKWQPVPLPIHPKELRLVSDSIVVTGPDAAGVSQSYAVEPNGQIAHLVPLEDHIVKKQKEPPPDSQRGAKNPLLGAVLDGWPLEGGTALVARDGALSRVRIADGAVVDTAPDAFPLKPSRCHAISLSPPKAPAAFGFVCGVPHGATEIYAYDPRGKLTTLRHFDGPRAVFSPSNGTLVVEGACEADATPVDIKKTEQSYCIMRKNQTFEDFVVNGDVGTERVVPLADGRTAIISPPASDLATARLTIFDGAHPSTIPIVFDGAKPAAPKARKRDDDEEDDEDHAAPDDGTIVIAVLRSGTWLRGVEERTPGVLSAWVEHSGRYVGVEVNVTGHAKHGPYVADLGTAVVSGRYGLGWSASRQGYETIDGGMTWKALALPEPLESASPAAGAMSHGCGPIGCALVGWIRVGWGATDETQSASVPDLMRSVDVRSPTALSLKCEAVGKAPLAGLDTTTSGRNEYGYYGGYGRYGYGGRAPQTQDWQPFFTIDAPKLATDDLGFSKRTDDIYEFGTTDRYNNTGHLTLSPLARVYAWGPKGLDWDTRGRFMVRFTSPFESSSALHVTATTPIPRLVADGTNFVSMAGAPPHMIQGIAVLEGDDATHALLVFKRWSNAGTQDSVVMEIEADRPGIEVHRNDGVPLGDIESGVRMSGRWYVATTESFSTVIWEVESGAAREVTRIPRVFEGHPVAVRLAKRADGHMLGAVIEGAPMMEGASRPSQWKNQMWALPIDVDSGAINEPERLGLADGFNKKVGVCGPEDGGWIVDGKWPSTGALSVSSASGSQLHSGSGGVYARYRVTATSLCVEKLSMGGFASDAASVGTLGKVDGPFVTLGLYVDRARQAFRCVSK